ncbi:Acg family FMN-binding oxidoreductase [Allokutzneria oryzae]|uniref:Acg family FMN-binding oxidoreductase n=1 Tax=Allokutzneria oryzae TaxID=1378989 RepID=A0ABV5ZYX3_9PSEU
MSSWSYDETKTLIRAVQLAPSVHNSQPWSLELSKHDALLFERRDITLPYHDPTGRDRLLSCGTALANLELAVRELGWRAETSLSGDSSLSDWVGTVTASTPQPATATEHAWYEAIPRRRSYRLPFNRDGLSADEIKVVIAAAEVDGVSTQLVAGQDEIHALAGLVEYATNVYRHDHAYQRELAGWITRRHNRRVRTGIPQERLGPGLRFGGLVRPNNPAPDAEVIAESISRETVLVFLSERDSRREHVLAGAALQRAWLSATALGLAASVVTQPLHLSEVRGRLADALELPGRPHALLRVGRPTWPIPAAPRRSAQEIAEPRYLEGLS